MSVLQAYSSLSSCSSRSTVTLTLISIASSPPVDSATCKTLTQILLDDLQKVIIDDNPTSSRLTRSDAFTAISAVKSLGKSPHGVQVLASLPSLKCLMTLAVQLKDTPDASDEALKCVANTLLLSEDARSMLLSEEIDGGYICLDLLQSSTTPQRIFLSSRILFFCTVSRHQCVSFLQSAVETKRTYVSGDAISIVDIVALKLDELIVYMQAGANMSRDAMSDLLKLAFNLLVHYPKLVPSEVQYPALAATADDQKVMGDFWNSQLDAILPPLVRAFQTVPLSAPNPLTSPLTHIIHSLITIPVDKSSRAIWFGTHISSPPSTSPESIADPLSDSSHDNRSSSEEPKSSHIEHIVSSGRRSSPFTHSAADCATRAFSLLDTTLAHFLPGDTDPDDPTVRDSCKRTEGDSSLDELVSPVVLLLTRFCYGDDAAKERIREWLVPADLDRTHPLEGRADLLGRCLRLLASVYHNRLKDSVGEMLYAMCDADASTLTLYFGYGNVAGFLFHKGITHLPPVSTLSAAPLTTTSGLPIDPITGIARVSEEVENPEELGNMTDEEKERESEKLFALFDRLEKSGVLHPSQNPYRKALEQGTMSIK